MIKAFGSGFLEKTINNFTENLILTNSKGEIQLVNSMFVRDYGYSKHEIIGKPVEILFAKTNDPDAVKEIVTLSFKGDWTGELYHQKKNGEDFLVSIKASIAKDKFNNSTALTMVTKDLTSIILSEKRLKKAQNDYYSLFLELQDAVFESTREGIIKDINPIGVKLLGYKSKKDLIGKNARDFYVDPIDRERLARKLQEKGYIKNYEIELKNRVGERIIVLETSKAIKDEHGKISGYRGILRDITEAKRNEEMMKKYVRELASANKKFFESEKELKIINASKDKFFSIISHDLKSPFTALIGLTDILIEDINELSKEEILSFSTNINKSARQVFNLLENLLNWSRIQTGRMKYNPTTFDVYSLVEENISLLQGNAARKNINLENDVLNNISVVADINMINSVIQNLISNALKFTQNGGSVFVSAKRRKSFVEIKVSDNGIGISEQDMEKLFRIDVHHTTKGTNSEVGTGLGLVLCKELIEKNNGKIWVESELGSGTTFIFTLPAKEKSVN